MTALISELWWPIALLAAACGLLLVRRRRSALRRLRRETGAPPARPAAAVRAAGQRIAALAHTDPRRLTLLAGVAAGGLGLLTGGPVAAVMGATYAALLVRAVLRHLSRRRAAAARTRSLDDLCALAADLRAGLPPAACRPPRDDADGRIAELTAAVWRLAERTGAPAADLVERIEADARAADRATATARAQAAGAQLTAMLLAGLPLGGIALGYSIGADPLEVLLHTGLGAACALGAVLLQCAGLLWSDRLVAGALR